MQNLLLQSKCQRKKKNTFSLLPVAFYYVILICTIIRTSTLFYAEILSKVLPLKSIFPIFLWHDFVSLSNMISNSVNSIALIKNWGKRLAFQLSGTFLNKMLKISQICFWSWCVSLLSYWHVLWHLHNFLLELKRAIIAL